MAFIIGLFNDLERTYSLFQILSGGLMFGAIFMATDPVTSPTTFVGQALYGMSLGILTIIFRHLTPFPEGVLTSILTMNMLVFIIDKIGVRARFNLKRSIPYFSVLAILLLGISCYIGISYQKGTDTEIDPNFEIYSKEVNGDTVTYMVGEKGYSSTLKAKIVITNNNVVSYEVLEQNDSYYSKITQANYINTLIKNQTKLNDVDTVAGVTFTSNGLKKMLNYTLEDYKENGNEEIKGEVVIDKDFEILLHNVYGSSHFFIISYLSFSVKMKLSITIINNVITNITVLEQNDSYYGKVLESDYINYLINNQANLENVDTVAGATITSSSFKQALIETLKEYIGDING